MWGLGQRPNCFSDAQFQRSRQQRCRQRSVPASNFALPQERPQAALSTLLHIVAPNGRDRPSRAARKSSRTRRPAAFICLIHFAQCFSFGSMSAKYARTCSGHASFDMCGTRNASSSSNELYAKFPIRITPLAVVLVECAAGLAADGRVVERHAAALANQRPRRTEQRVN